jgi:hypothetical protein
VSAPAGRVIFVDFGGVISDDEFWLSLPADGHPLKARVACRATLVGTWPRLLAPCLPIFGAAYCAEASSWLESRRACRHHDRSRMVPGAGPTIQARFGDGFGNRRSVVLRRRGRRAGVPMCWLMNSAARSSAWSASSRGPPAKDWKQPVPASGSQGLGSSLDRAREHLELPLTVDDLARRAQDLLENTDDTIERIATLCGFGSAHQMRTHFRRINRVTPQAYQRTFCPVSGIVARRDAVTWGGQSPVRRGHRCRADRRGSPAPAGGRLSQLSLSSGLLAGRELARSAGNCASRRQSSVRRTAITDSLR